jgi:hypothetical protein
VVCGRREGREGKYWIRRVSEVFVVTEVMEAGVIGDVGVEGIVH